VNQDVILQQLPQPIGIGISNVSFITLDGMPKPATKITIASLLIAAGLGVAMLFPRRDLPTTEIADPSKPPVVRTMTAGDAQRKAPSAPNITRLAKAPAETQPTTVPSAPRRPMIPQEKPAVATPPRQATPPELPPSFEAGLESSAEGSAVSAPVIPQARPAEQPMRTHRVVDGDTLRGLARRYLGNSERFGEIFEANRDVLRDPDILPIGQKIKVPPKDGPRASKSSNFGPSGSSRLVPVPP